MIYRILKNTYRIPVKLRDKLEIPSLCAVCDYIDSHAADSRQCVFESDNDAAGKKKWEKFKSVSLFIPAPFPYVLVEQYELDETDPSGYIGFLTEKKVEAISNIDFENCKELDKLIIGMKIERRMQECAEKEVEAKKNAKRRK